MASTGTPSGVSDEARLQDLVEVWHRCAQDTLALLRSLADNEWALPTDLPGWDVRAVAAHLAHLESQLAGDPQPHVEVPPAPHVKGLLGEYTEGGILARAGRSTDELLEELAASIEKRHAELTGNPPTDASAPATGFAELMGWSWETLLTNRPIDLWMHEQDVRRAVGRPGNLASPGAVHAAGVFARSLGFVLGKKAGAPPGTTLVLEVTGALPQVVGAVVGANGRGSLLHELPTSPSARLTMDFETWMVLAGGRRGPDDVEVEGQGDAELCRRILDNLAVTL